MSRGEMDGHGFTLGEAAIQQSGADPGTKTTSLVTAAENHNNISKRKKKERKKRSFLVIRHCHSL